MGAPGSNFPGGAAFVGPFYLRFAQTWALLTPPVSFPFAHHVPLPVLAQSAPVPPLPLC
jgi:hypothetical protein